MLAPSGGTSIFSDIHIIVAPSSLSTDTERAFLRGRLTVPRLRHSFSDESVRASMLLGSWAQIPELVPERKAIHRIKAIVRQARQEAAAANAAEVIVVE